MYSTDMGVLELFYLVHGFVLLLLSKAFMKTAPCIVSLFFLRRVFFSTRLRAPFGKARDFLLVMASISLSTCPKSLRELVSGVARYFPARDVVLRCGLSGLEGVWTISATSMNAVGVECHSIDHTSVPRRSLEINGGMTSGISCQSETWTFKIEAATRGAYSLILKTDNADVTQSFCEQLMPSQLLR